MSTDTLPDQALIARSLAGDESAFRTLYRRHTPRLRMVIRRLLGRREAETDDVLQECWLAACRGLARFRGQSQFSTWLTTIGVRAARSRLLLPRLADDAGGDEAIEHLPTPDRPAGELIDLERAIARLPDHQRVVLVLHDIEGWKHVEIATRLGIAAGTSKATLSRAREALRAMLGDLVNDRV